jgi:hypothetical protein
MKHGRCQGCGKSELLVAFRGYRCLSCVCMASEDRGQDHDFDHDVNADERIDSGQRDQEVGSVIVITSREQWRELYGKDCPQRWFEPLGIEVLEVETMDDGLTLFGKAMEHREHGFGYKTEPWFAMIGGLRIIIERMAPSALFCASVGEIVLGPHATPELARDDAERTLRALYEALAIVLEHRRSA